MNQLNDDIFKNVSTRPRWEGIILTGLGFSDHRISVFSTDPIPELKDYIESIWYMRWNLPEKNEIQCIQVPNPCAKFVALQQKEITYAPLIVGTRQLSMFFKLQGSGETVGIDFKPGGLYPFLGFSMSNWPIEGIKADQFIDDIPKPPQEEWTEISLYYWIKNVQECFYTKLKQCVVNNYNNIFPIVNYSLSSEFKNVEDMAKSFGTSLRSLQRIFQNEVGVTPRDLIRINRFNEAIRNISENDFKSFAEVALKSGFFDQPHMINEFQKLVDSTPARFRRYL